jgi:hypothetical protein
MGEGVVDAMKTQIEQLLEQIPPTEQITIRRTSTGGFIAWTNRDGLYRNKVTAEAAIADAILDFTKARPEPVRSWSYPTTLTEELNDALGLMCFITGPIAHYLRTIGHKIKTKAEDEQAYVLHLLILTVLEHGANWRRVAAKKLLPPPTEGATPA